MATFRSCIDEAEQEGRIDPETAEFTRQAYEAAAGAAEGFGPDEADRAGARGAMDALEKAAIETERRQVLQARARARLLEGNAGLKRSRGYTEVDALGRGGGGGRGPDGEWTQGGRPPPQGPFKKGAVSARGLELLMRNKGGKSGGPFPSVEGRYLAIRGPLDALMADVIEKFETHYGFDTPGRATLENVVREAHGEPTGDSVSKALAEAWGRASEYTRQLFNAAGGAISKRADWGMPQSHDAGRVMKAGRDAWRSFLLPLLDRDRMVDRYTGAPLADDALADAVGKAWDRITTNGLVSRHPDDSLGRGSKALQRGDERFLVFHSADAWLQYQREFGRADPFDAMMGHLDGMSRDIAMMEILGPNPEAQFAWLKRMAEIEAAQEQVAGNAGALDRARGHIDQAQRMWESFTGEANVPTRRWLAHAGATTRGVLTGLDLGGAVLTDLPSAPLFGAMARTLAGLSKTGDVLQLASLLNPADGSMRKIARRSGFINESARDGLISASQDSLRLLTIGDKMAGGMNVMARRLPATVLRMSGLTPIFEARKRSFRMEFMGTLADRTGMTLQQMLAGSSEEAAMASELMDRGFTAEEWDAIRSTPPWEPEAGVTMLRTQDIEAHLKAAGRNDAHDLAMRVGEMVLNLEQYAVPVSGSLWTRAAMVGGARPGTYKGEAMRSFWMFKTFPISTAYLYAEEFGLQALARGAPKQVGWATGAALAATYLAISGAITIQLKALKDGKDPRYMGDPKFWLEAQLQGGSYGIMGDFLHSSLARTGHNAGVALGGPVVDALADVAGLTLGEAKDAAFRKPGEKDHEIARAANFARKYTPGASVFWAKTAFNRAVVDQLQQMADPDAKDAFERATDRQRTETGQELWWERGHTTPTRAPDLSAALRRPVDQIH